MIEWNKLSSNLNRKIKAWKNKMKEPGSNLSCLHYFAWRRKRQPTLVFLPGKFRGLGSLVGYSPWGRKESDMTELPHFLSFYSSIWRKKWQPTPVFLPEESHGHRGLVGL